MSSVKFQSHAGQKEYPILTQVGRFQTVTPFSIDRWLRNDAQSLKYHRKGSFFSMSSVKFQGYTG